MVKINKTVDSKELIKSWLSVKLRTLIKRQIILKLKRWFLVLIFKNLKTNKIPITLYKKLFS